MKNKQIGKAVCIGLAVAVAVLLAVAFTRVYRQRQAEAEFERLAQLNDTDADAPVALEAETAPPDEGKDSDGEKDPLAVLEEMGVPIPDKSVDFESLQETASPDIYAWIYIPDSMIDYPVLQHPTDNIYYLEHNMDGSKGYPGCIYTEDYNAKDFSDPHTVLYGHNMKNGTMFAGLHKYEDSKYFEEHPYIYIYTPEGLLVYEIFAAYEYSNLHLLLNYDFTNEVIYQGYLNDIKEVRSMNCNIKEDVEVTVDNRILTLSTCIADKPDNRYLVQGVLLNE